MTGPGMPLDAVLRRFESFRRSHGKVIPMNAKPLPNSQDLRGVRNSARARSLLDTIVEDALGEIDCMSECFVAQRKLPFVLAVPMTDKRALRFNEGSRDCV